MSSAIFKSHPDLQKGLAKETIEALGVSNKEAFKKEIEYLQAINAVFDVLYNYNESCSSVRSAINNPKNNDKSETLVNVQGMVSLSQGYHQLYQHGLQLVRDRLDSNKSENILEPRIVRLGNKLKLTEKETYAMAYVILSNAQMLTHRYGRGFDFPEMAQACDMNIIEAMAFFSPSRVHVKEAIISPDAEDPHSYGFKVPYTTCVVLAGLPLSEETLLKIDKTLLAEVLLEENNDDYSMLSVGTAEERRDRLKKSDSTDFDSLFSKIKDDDDEDKKSEKEDNNDDFKFDDDEDKKDEEEESKDIFEMVRDEIQKEKDKPVEEEEEEPKSEENDKQKMQPYTTNTAYLSDHIEWLYVLIRVKLMIQENMSEMSKDVEKETQIRELKAKERMLRTKCEKKLTATLEANKWVPRLEKLVTHLQLSHFEKMVLLVLTANVLSPKISPDDSRYNSRVSNFTVGNLMGLFTDSFEQEIENRKYFYKNATLVKQGIVSLESSYRNNELMNVEVELDRRMLDFVVGLDTEFSELVEGSHLYHSTVKLDKVVLPEKQKADIVQAVKNFEQFQKAKKRLGLEEFLAYGSGLVLLFHGKSGTGKTMMANAIANMLDKRILLINFPSLGSRDSDVLIKFIFREAKLTDSIIFFDECESIFQSRDRSDSSVNLLLTELEMHNQLVIMATNRAFDLDEAMHRRINHAVEFQVPNPRLRNQIWQAHLPSSVTLDKDVNLQDLAIRFELSGGFIKNSIVSALSSAVSRNPSSPVVSMSDLTAGAEYQLRARLKMTEFDGRVVPDHGLEDLITTNEVKQKIRKIIRVEKARQVLYSEWGYSDKGANAQGTSVLFYGPPGSGKTHAAEAIGFEVGKPLKIENARNSYHKSDFESAAENDAIFVLDNAGSLFKKPTTEDGKKVEQTEHLDLLYHMEKFQGITIVIANSLENVDPTFLKGFKFIVEFHLPTAENREVLWKKLLPPYAPVASDVDFKALATKYNFSGGNIKNACFQAAAVAALRLEETEQSINMKDLLEAAEEESGNPLPEAVVYV